MSGQLSRSTLLPALAPARRMSVKSDRRRTPARQVRSSRRCRPGIARRSASRRGNAAAWPSGPKALERCQCPRPHHICNTEVAVWVDLTPAGEVFDIARARVSAKFGADVADRTAKRREDLVVRHRKPMVGVQLLGGVLGNPPTRGCQLLTGWTARTDPHQIGDIDIQSVLAPATA